VGEIIGRIFNSCHMYMKKDMIQKVGIFYSKGNVINEEHEDNK
jgi:hypothetical protein